MMIESLHILFVSCPRTQVGMKNSPRQLFMRFGFSPVLHEDKAHTSTLSCAPLVINQHFCAQLLFSIFLVINLSCAPLVINLSFHQSVMRISCRQYIHCHCYCHLLSSIHAHLLSLINYLMRTSCNQSFLSSISQAHLLSSVRYCRCHCHLL